MLEEFNNDDDEKFDVTKDFIGDLVFDAIKGLLVLGVFALLVIYFIYNPIEYPTKEEATVETAVVKTIYKNEDKYYLTAFNETTRIVYIVEITKEDFIKYKVDDNVKIVVRKNKAKLYEESTF